MHRSEIESALGRPDAATPNGVVYQFYRLPGGSIGGGPELHVSYASDGRCSKAEWTFSQ